MVKLISMNWDYMVHAIIVVNKSETFDEACQKLKLKTYTERKRFSAQLCNYRSRHGIPIKRFVTRISKKKINNQKKLARTALKEKE